MSTDGTSTDSVIVAGVTDANGANRLQAFADQVRCAEFASLDRPPCEFVLSSASLQDSGEGERRVLGSCRSVARTVSDSAASSRVCTRAGSKTRAVGRERYRHNYRSERSIDDPDGHPYGHACGYSRLDSSFWWRHHVHRQTLLKWPLRRYYVTRLIRPEDTVCEVVPGAFV